MAGPFKMKGNPMQRNFAIGSPLLKEKYFLERKTTIPMEGAPRVKPKPKSTSNPKPKLAPRLKDDKIETKSGVTKGDVAQTIVAPHLDIRKTVKVVKHYTPPKVKKKIKSIIKKGKDWWKSSV